MNATLVGKTCTMEVHEKHPHLKKDLADLLLHNERTATDDYQLQETGKKVAKTSEAVRQIIRGKEPDSACLTETAVKTTMKTREGNTCFDDATLKDF